MVTSDLDKERERVREMQRLLDESVATSRMERERVKELRRLLWSEQRRTQNMQDRIVELEQEMRPLRWR